MDTEITAADDDLVVGCKLLRLDGRSLNGRVQYDLSGAWQEVPGNGAYVAVTGGLTTGGTGEQLVWLECREPTGAKAPEGVVTYRQARVIAACPERCAPELRGAVALYAPGLTAEQRLVLAETSTEEWRGKAARDASDLSAEQRLALVP